MDDGLKQRLVGAVVLVAVGVIFIPGLLDNEGRRQVDVATQVPPEPVVMPRPLSIPDPVKPQNIPQPNPAADNYQLSEDPVPEVEQVSGLTEEGVPYAWAIQVSSFESEKNANNFQQKLTAGGYKAYTQSSTVAGKKVYRVFVGPKINREIALVTKAEIDKKYRTEAMVVEFKP